MNQKVTFVLFLLLGTLTGIFNRLQSKTLATRAHADANPAPKTEVSRTFEFTYSAIVKDLPRGEHKVRIWIPLASSDANQKVQIKRIACPLPTRTTRDSQYGNRMLYAELRNPDGALLSCKVDYEVTRKEYSKGGYAELRQYDRESVKAPEELKRFLRPDRLVPIDGRMKELAEQNTAGKLGSVDKALALYDYVFKTVRYDKSGTGWGRGDTLWVCDAKHGNCTDFHSLYISMMRAEGIPARFEIGFPLPENSARGDIPGYHCWAEFYLYGPGWIPVDISEAWKNPSKHDYFFGTLDANRVQFTIGRDLILSPRQDGPPVNYFVYPYVEVDGQPYDKLEKNSLSAKRTSLLTPTFCLSESCSAECPAAPAARRLTCGVRSSGEMSLRELDILKDKA